jgi:uncharacterized membrane protein YdbT with pleckstrin-like domain
MKFKPSPALKKRYAIEAVLTYLIGIFSWLIPVTSYIPQEYLLLYLLLGYVPVIASLIYIFWWIPKFYESAEYEISDMEVISRYGVFLKQERKVSFPKINMVSTTEGIIQRRFGTKHLHVHTAAIGTATAEVVFLDLADAEKIKADLTKKVESSKAGKGKQVKVDEEEEEVTVEGGMDKVVEELVKIRKLVERLEKTK